MRPIAPVLAVSALLIVTSCASSPPTMHPVARMAPFDLNCPREQIHYVMIDEGTIGVVGCAQRTKYVKICHSVGYALYEHQDCRWIRN